MSSKRSLRPLTEELPRLLRDRQLSLRALAREVSVSPGHLSRVLRETDGKTASPELCRRIAVALELREDYFPEVRAAVVIDAVRRDGELRDRFYDRTRNR